MQRWEYIDVIADHENDCVILTGGKQIEDIREYMDARGADGWELVAVVPITDRTDFSRLYFKRPLKES